MKHCVGVAEPGYDLEAQIQRMASPLNGLGNEWIAAEMNCGMRLYEDDG